MGRTKDSQKPVDWMSELQRAGFAVTEQPGKGILVSKDGAGALLEKTATGEPRFVVRPGLMTTDGVAQLIDKGFQKFWQSANRSRPAVAADLTAFHKFESELRAAMKMTSLYNESLGTVSSLYVYDRVEGREKPKVRQPFD
jgi:hypothetical protein